MARIFLYGSLLFLFLLALLEAGARLAQPFLVKSVPAYYYRQYLSSLMEESPVMLWAGKPGARAEITNSKGEKIDYRMNALGWRGAEFTPLTRPANALVFGDSFSFGTGVKESAVYSRVLERSFTNMNVWNLGQMGYSPDQYMLLSQHWLTAFPWAFLVVQLSNNDVADIASHGWRKMNSGSGIPAALEPSPELWFFTGVSEAWDMLAYWNLQKSEGARTDVELRGGMFRLLFSLKHVLELARERKVPVVLLQASDWGENVYGKATADDYRNGVRALSLEFNSPLIEMRGAELLPFPDLHWTEASHQKAAGELLVALKSMQTEGKTNTKRKPKK